MLCVEGSGGGKESYTVGTERMMVNFMSTQLARPR